MSLCIPNPVTAEVRSISVGGKEPQIEERGHCNKRVRHRATSLRLPEFRASQACEQPDPSLVANALNRVGNVVPQGVFPHAANHGGPPRVAIKYPRDQCHAADHDDPSGPLWHREPHRQCDRPRCGFLSVDCHVITRLAGPLAGA
jgi:hypothetical protein